MLKGVTQAPRSRGHHALLVIHNVRYSVGSLSTENEITENIVSSSLCVLFCLNHKVILFLDILEYSYPLLKELKYDITNDKLANFTK